MFPKNRMMLSMAYFKIRTAHQRDENKDNDWTPARNICLCFGQYDCPGAAVEPNHIIPNDVILAGSHSLVLSLFGWK